MSQVKAVQTINELTNNNEAHLMADRDFHGAAIIDANGNEVPITEEMIQKACNDLSNAWLFPRQVQKH